MGVAVGIDLGTTNSCMAVVQANKARVVADNADRRIHPSVVSFHPDGAVLAGHEGKERQIIDVPNTIYSFKRLIGRDLTAPEMQNLLEDLPYDVHVGDDDIPSISVLGREISLPEVSAMMLRHLRELCGKTLGVEIKDAVITVPANFNDVQRSMTKVAGRIAGFNVLRILNEPTAAALAYGFGGELTERIAIYDFGGGTFDITIVELADDIFEVLSTSGDTYLGGDDFDKKIVEEMCAGFQREHSQDLTDNTIALQRIRSVAEKVKCQLSSIDEVQATLREIADDRSGTPLDFNFKLTRHRFEMLIEPFVDKSLRVCEEALKLAGLDRSSLDNLILVGGTTRIPLVRKKVAEFFGMEPRTEINPDEVVAIGASIQAFSLTGEQLPENLPTPSAAEKMKDRTGLTSAIRSSLGAKKVPSRAPEPPAKQAPSETTAYGAPKPFPLGPTPQNEPSSMVQRTLHGMPGAPTPGGGIATKPPPAIATPLEPEPEIEEPFGDEDFDTESLEIDIKHKAPPPPPPSTTDQWGSGVDSDALGIDLKHKAPISPPPSTTDQWGPDFDTENLDIDIKHKAPPPPPPSTTDQWGAVDDFEVDVKKQESPSQLPLDQSTDEVSDELPAVLEAPPSFDEEGSFDAESDFGVLDDMPIPGTENDEVVGLLSPLGADAHAVAPLGADAHAVAPLGADAHSLTPLGADAHAVTPLGADAHSLTPLTPPVEEQEMSIPVPPTTAQSALLLDVTPRALGVGTAGGFCDTIIERNAAIPVEQSRLFNTSTDNQTEVSIDVYQGESRRIVENTQLGQILLTDIRPAPRGEIKIRITFEIDTDGILGVAARNEETGEAQTTSIVLTGGMDDEKVEELVQKYADQ
ncbi:MAG: Hsp70 family protein [Deltaproteobacteria bacterium]|nr:Hsp70 family protein [Deltaproteobacteria bacterium]